MMRVILSAIACLFPLLASAGDLYVLEVWGILGGQAQAITLGPLPAEKCEAVRQRMKDGTELAVPPNLPLQVSLCVAKEALPARLAVPWNCIAQSEQAVPRLPAVRLWAYACLPAG